MDKNIKVRLYKRGDADGINAMLTKSLPYLRDRAFWVWINRIVGESISVVAEFQGKIVGHYAVVQRVISLNGKEVKAAIGIHAFIDPEYRRRVFIYEISKVLYKIAQDKGIQLIYGFPNINYRSIQLKIEGWKQVDIFKSYELDSSEVSPSMKTNIQFVRVDNIDYFHLFQIGEIYEKKCLSNSVIPENGVSNWLNRYFLHPQKPYTIYCLKKEESIIGYLVIKHYEKENHRYSHIIDYVLAETTDIGDVVQTYIGREKDCCDTFSVWKGDDDFKSCIVKLGFREKGFDTFLGVKVLDNSIDNIDCLFDINNWRLVMGDSDAF